MSDTNEILSVENLSISFPGKNDPVMVVDDISFNVQTEETVGLVGESGSGKTISALAVMRLSRRPAYVEQGKIWFQGENIQAKTEYQMNQIRGFSMSMIFQSPRSSLNPLMKVGDQIARVVRIQQGVGQKESIQRAREMLDQVGISDSKRHLSSYPHQLSGGMCQRILISMMISCEPKLLIADEPTTGLDVTVQAQIFDLIKEVQEMHRMAMLLITHDLGVVAELCERMVVMYAGHIMETGRVEHVFEKPLHPYTQMLLQSMLRADRKIEAAPPDMGNLEEAVYSIDSCRFTERCPFAMDVCREKKPALVEVKPGHMAMCHLYPAE